MSNEQNSTKTNINWYPGHMAKARNEIIEKIKVVDIVYVLLDARIPYSSSNPMINDILQNKKKILSDNLIEGNNNSETLSNLSENDIFLTKRVQEAGRLIGIELLDHIIIGNNCYISFAEEQLL